MIIISGPSTVGKNPFIYKACEVCNLKYVIPCTTRTIRQEEKNRKDYIFLSKSKFQSKIQSGNIKEWDYCLENYYGYIFDFPGGHDQITHGLSRLALRIKAKYPSEITTIFLKPSSMEKIYDNLKQIYCGKELLLRMALVEEEMCHSILFDKVISVSNLAEDLLDEKEVVQFIENQKRHLD